MKWQSEKGAWVCLFLFISSIVFVAYLAEMCAAYVSPEERDMRQASDTICGALQRYRTDHGTFPVTLAELAPTYVPTGFNTSYLDRFTFTWKQETYANSSGWSYSLTRKWEPQPNRARYRR